MSEQQKRVETTDIQSQRIVDELMASRKKRMEIEQNWDNVRIAKENAEAQKRPDINNVPLILRPDYGRSDADKMAFTSEELPFCVLYPDLGAPTEEYPHLKSPSEEKYTASVSLSSKARCICKANRIVKTSPKTHTRD